MEVTIKLDSYRLKEVMEVMKAIIDLMCLHLDTRDKRFMFLKIFFPQSLPSINIEGSPRQTCTSIYFHFDRQGMKNELAKILNKHFSF